MTDPAALVDVAQAAHATQVTQLSVAVDPAKLVWGAVGLLFAGLLSALAALGRLLMTKLDGVAQTSAATAHTTQVIHQELFGATGQNGLRSEVRRMSQQLEVHDELLIRLAEREGVDARRDARDATHPRRTA